MSEVEDSQMVVDSCQMPGRAELLATLLVGLEQCNKSLNQYLEMKRKTFPRFYFLANAALLEMLSSGEDPHAVQRHMSDCFDNLDHLTFKPVKDLNEEEYNQQPQSIKDQYTQWLEEQKLAASKPASSSSSSSRPSSAMVDPHSSDDHQSWGVNGPLSNIAYAMNSKEGEEIVPLSQDFVCSGAVENWLARLVQRMRETLKEILSRAKDTADHWDDYERPRHKWLFDYPAQIALAASQIIWTEEVNTHFESFQDGNEQAMKEYAKTTLDNRLRDLISLVLGDLTPGDRIKIMTLITVDVHNRDVVNKLIEQRIVEASSFAWQSQMRYSWEDQLSAGVGVGGLPFTSTQVEELKSKSAEERKECFIKVADGTWSYSYEYIGNTARLVITPLTDRCYITLTQALRLIMGGAPAGPAGTGKTETTKDLGRAMGVSTRVWNCSEQMNVQSMSAIFKGLAQTGAWGCFDEFNRIQIEVLSVISTQVSTVLNAIKSRKEEFDFMGDICRLVPSVGMFITMNPGYTGRTELPENLKALFRSCAMCVPDMDLICENMLMSEGFQNANRLTKKFVTLYSLCSSLLSKQRHYDWGLRACKAVLRVAGGLKRAEPNIDETRILMRALRDFNSPKLVDADKSIFGQLIEDLFPGLSSTTLPKRNEKLEDVIKIAASHKRGLQPEEKFVRKCVELADLMVIRHSVFLIGPSCSGKSEIWHTLADALNTLPLPPSKDDDPRYPRFHETVYEVINPKAVLNKELYGWLSKSDWNDGLLSKVMREMAHCKGQYRADQTYQWVVLDGDIDPDWIESLNTVMDDNKMLTLVSNERISLTKPMRLVFEISNLDNATPATVSRAGIIYINSTDIGSKPFLDSWVERRPNDKDSLLAMFNKFMTTEVMNDLLLPAARVIPVGEVTMVRTLCYLLEGLLDALYEAHRAQGKRQPGGGTEALSKEVIELAFVFACSWAFGGSVVSDKTKVGRKDYSERWKSHFAQVKLSNTTGVFDFYLDEKGQVMPWSVDAYVPPLVNPQNVTQVFIPTLEYVRMKYIIDLLVEKQRPALLVGGAGTGKSKIIMEYLRNLRSRDEKKTFASVNINYYTDSKALQKIFESRIDKRAGRVYGPIGNKKLIFFLDDLNMSYLDVYNTQSCIQLIKQHMDYGFWYDMSRLEKKEIHDLQYLAAMNPTAGSFTVSDRLQGQFPTFAISMAESSDLKQIYGQVLRHHLSQFGRQEFNDLLEPLTKATLDLYDYVSATFMPSTRKFHYQFNMRDVSAIFQGLCNAQPGQGYTPYQYTQLWLYEATRVFSDRLIDQSDIAAFENTVGDKYRDSFRKVLQLPSSHVPPNAPERGDLSTLFSAINVTGEYKVVEDIEAFKATLVSRLDDYNSKYAKMDLVLFDLAVYHVTRIVRILRSPNGNALLVGVGGSGKQSLCRLAAHICDYSVVQLSISQDFTTHDLRTAMQDMYKRAGVKNIELVFMLTDTQILNDQWLSMINDLLCTGIIPGLFNDEDLDQCLNSLRNEAKAKGIPDSRDALIEFFVQRVRANLHVVLCFSPVGEAFRIRCRKFPGLITCTTIDWFHPWPHDALVSVAKRFLAPILPNQEHLDAISDHMAVVHTSVSTFSTQYRQTHKRFNYTTPKSFLELVHYYKHLLDTRSSESERKIKRLQLGITALSRAAQTVEELKVIAAKKKEELAEKSKLVAEAKRKTEAESAKVAVQKSHANIESEKASEAEAKAKAIEAECLAEMKQLEPDVERAKAAAMNLNKKSLESMRSSTNPAPDTVLVTNAVMVLLGLPGRDWKAAKQMMTPFDKFMEKLVGLAEEGMTREFLTETQLKKMSEFTSNPRFDHANMSRISAECGALYVWVENMLRLNMAQKNIAPKRESLDRARAEYKKAREKLDREMVNVANATALLNEVSKKLDDVQAEEELLKRDMNATQFKCELAEKFVTSLADNLARYTQQISELKTSEATMLGDVMVSASFVSYLGAFNQEYRVAMWQQTWVPDLQMKGIAVTPGMQPLKTLANDDDFAAWRNQGLASDQSSLENGAIVTQCKRWPLLIDPQLQGIRWIRGHVKNLVTVQQNQPNYLQTVIRCIQDGTELLIDSLPEEIDATLEPLLTRQLVQRGNKKYIKLSGDEIPYHDSFKLYLQSKLANPHYRPEVFAQCTLINFIVTETGLEDQLLSIVIDREKPDLEGERLALVRAINENTLQLSQVEDGILDRLMNLPPNILDDNSLLESLDQAKRQSRDVDMRVATAVLAEARINAARNHFKPVAAEGSWIYFLLTQLNNIDHMYQFSLSAFIGFFKKAMTKTPKSTDDIPTPEHIANLREAIRMTVFTWVTRGLFERHKLIFSSQLCFKLMEKGALGEYDPSYYDFLIRGHRRTSDTEKCPDWLPKAAWESVLYLSSLDGFEKLSKDITANSHRFKEWYVKPRIESIPVPMEWRKLDEQAPFKKLLILRAFRPDRMVTAMENYVRNTLPDGKNYVECDSGRSFLEVLALSLDDASSTNPIFFILSPGADPIASVETLAKKHGMYDSKLHRIALGQGQDIAATQRLELGAKEGHWVVLENIHLMPVWLKELEKKLDDLEATGTHENFRVFLSAEPSDAIPIGILERSVKLTNEPPQGLKQNLQRALTAFDRESFDYYDAKVKSILFGLCHFHSVIIERTKFGPKGWNRTYPFNTGDLLNSSTVIQAYLDAANNADNLPWKDLRYMVGEILYGGHITDDWDRLVCVTYLKFYLRDELLDEMELCPFSESFPEESFRSPPVLPYDQYFDYVDKQLTNESPVAFGMHPNEEIAVKTSQAATLFSKILELQPTAGGSAGGDAISTQQKTLEQLEQIRESLKGISFNAEDVIQRMEERGPFQNVFLQECDRMTILVKEINRSIKELQLGMNGELQMSESMEKVQSAIFLGRIPASWEILSYASLRTLPNWVANLVERATQLQEWTEDPSNIPVVVHIDRLFNPQSFLTAIMQKNAQRNKLELDKLVIHTEVTRKKAEDIDSRSRDGVYITGLYLEGARLNINTGTLEECAPREMFYPMPVIAAKAILAEKAEKNGIYRCPVYKTQQRGPTYVFTASLRTKVPADKWVLAGTTMVMEIAD